MNYEELIYDLMDGTLSPEKEKALFLEFAANESLRNELKTQLKIKSAVYTDYKAFNPKPETTVELFSKLGFTPMIAPAPKPTFFDKIINFAGVYKQAIVASVLSSVATIIVMFMLMDNSGININNQTPDLSEINKSDYPIVSSMENNNSDTDNQTPMSELTTGNDNEFVKIKYKYVPIYIDKETNDENKIFDEKLTQKELLTHSVLHSDINENDKIIELMANNRINSEHISNIGIGRDMPADMMFVPLTYKNDIIEFEIKAGEYFNINGGDALPSGFQKFNNISIIAFYKINEAWQIGAEYRRENFYQKYISQDETNLLWRYEQQPNFNSLGLAIRYKPFENSYSKIPFIQFVLGANEVGFIGRSILGAEFDLNNNLSFILSGDYSLLRYTHQSKWYNSQKLGLHFGIGIKY